MRQLSGIKTKHHCCSCTEHVFKPGLTILLHFVGKKFQMPV